MNATTRVPSPALRMNAVKILKVLTIVNHVAHTQSDLTLQPISVAVRAAIRHKLKVNALSMEMGEKDHVKIART